MANIGFIGMGNMGKAMLFGALKKYEKDDFIFFDPSYIGKETEILLKESACDVVKEAKYIILAIKPNIYEKVLSEIVDDLNEDKVLISLAPTVDIEKLSTLTKNKAKIVRCMPNTPALVLSGMTGIAFNDKLSDEEMKFIDDFFLSFGKYEIVEESLMNAVVCASGSSPAYVYMFIEALADSVVKCGMPRDMAYKFVAQTVLGSAKMVLETSTHPGKLKDNVCSPAGTTIEAVAALEEAGLRNALFKATEACYNKCKS